MGSMFFLPIMNYLICNCRISFKPLELLGKASFNIFLTQMVFYYAAAEIVYIVVPGRKLQLFVCLVACIVGGVLFYYVEQPITKLLINKVRKMKM